MPGDVSVPNNRHANQSYCNKTGSVMVANAGDVWTVFWPMLFGEEPEYERKIPDHELFVEAVR